MLVYNPSDKINAKLFGTYQKTKISGKTNPEFKNLEQSFKEFSCPITEFEYIKLMVKITKYFAKYDFMNVLLIDNFISNR